MVPRVMLMKSGLVSINAPRQIAVLVSTARPVNAAYIKQKVNVAKSKSCFFKNSTFNC